LLHRGRATGKSRQTKSLGRACYARREEVEDEQKSDTNHNCISKRLKDKQQGGGGHSAKTIRGKMFLLYIHREGPSLNKRLGKA